MFSMSTFQFRMNCGLPQIESVKYFQTFQFELVVGEFVFAIH